jgi:predicted peptidase
MKKRKTLWPFLIFWIGSGGVLVFRLGYDLKTWHFGSTIVVRTAGTYDYLLHLPRGYHDFGKRPLLVFLHGAGEVNKNVNVLRKLDVFHYANGTVPANDFPFIVVSPVTRRHGWDSRQVVKFLDEFLDGNHYRYTIDTNRIYLTGFSMGGFGTFRVACDYPDRFAAIIPLAGGGEPENAAKLQMVPTWAFHGDADDVVSYDTTKNMIDAMKSLDHPNVKLTTLHGAGHGIPEMVYTRPELYRWLLEQQKPKK